MTLHHPIAEKIQEHNNKFNENATLLFLNKNDLTGLSTWAHSVGHRLLEDAEGNPQNYWGLTIISVDDNFFEAACFHEEDIKLAIDNKLNEIKKTTYKANEVNKSSEPPYSETRIENGCEILKVPNVVKVAYQKFLEQQ